MSARSGWGHTLRDAAYGALFACLAGIPVVAYLWTLEPKPYHSVQLVDVRYLPPNRLEIVANFQKDDGCSFKELAVFAKALGVWSKLRWEDLEEPRGDRIAGAQTLRIAIFYRDVHDTVQIRTRHLCDDEKVDMVFLTYDRVRAGPHN